MLSMKERYAITLLLESNTVEYTKIFSIVYDYGYSLDFAYQVARLLAKAGLVSNKKGPNNGIILLKPLEDISLYDVFIAVNKEKLCFKDQDNLDMILIEEYKKIKISLFKQSI